MKFDRRAMRLRLRVSGAVEATENRRYENRGRRSDLWHLGEFSLEPFIRRKSPLTRTASARSRRRMKKCIEIECHQENSRRRSIFEPANLHDYQNVVDIRAQHAAQRWQPGPFVPYLHCNRSLVSLFDYFGRHGSSRRCRRPACIKSEMSDQLADFLFGDPIAERTSKMTA